MLHKIPGSPCLHNFNVRIPEHGSLGMRLPNTAHYGGHLLIVSGCPQYSSSALVLSPDPLAVLKGGLGTRLYWAHQLVSSYNV